MRLANEIAAAAMEYAREHLRPGMKESRRRRALGGFVHGAGTGWKGGSSWHSGSRSSGRGLGSRRSPRPATCRCRRTSRRCSRSGSAPTATGATTPRTSARASCDPEYAELERRLLAVYERRDRALSAGSEPRGARSTVREGIADAGYPGQPSHPVCARRRRPRARTALRAPGRRGTIEEGMVLAIEPGIYWEGGGGLRVEDNFLVSAERRREALLLP